MSGCRHRVGGQLSYTGLVREKKGRKGVKDISHLGTTMVDMNLRLGKWQWHGGGGGSKDSTSSFLFFLMML